MSLPAYAVWSVCDCLFCDHKKTEEDLLRQARKNSDLLFSFREPGVVLYRC